MTIPMFERDNVRIPTFGRNNIRIPGFEKQIRSQFQCLEEKGDDSNV